MAADRRMQQQPGTRRPPPPPLPAPAHELKARGELSRVTVTLLAGHELTSEARARLAQDPWLNRLAKADVDHEAGKLSIVSTDEHCAQVIDAATRILGDAGLICMADAEKLPAAGQELPAPEAEAERDQLLTLVRVLSAAVEEQVDEAALAEHALGNCDTERARRKRKAELLLQLHPDKVRPGLRRVPEVLALFQMATRALNANV